MDSKVILYYLALMFFAGWALGGLIRASNALCGGNPFKRPKEKRNDRADT